MRKEFEPMGANGTQKDVKISFSGTTITVDKNKVEVYEGQDTVGWSGGVQFTILNLPGGPIHSTPHGSNWIATGGPWNSQGKMKYDVAATGYTTLDPEIDVIPNP